MLEKLDVIIFGINSKPDQTEIFFYTGSKTLAHTEKDGIMGVYFSF